MKNDKKRFTKYTDEEVLNDLNSNSKKGKAFEWFYLMARDYLKKISPLKDQHDFEDVFQESSSDLIKTIHRYKGKRGASLLTYLSNIVRYKSIDFFRQHQKRKIDYPGEVERVNFKHTDSIKGDAHTINNRRIAWLKKTIIEIIDNENQANILIYRKMGYTHKEISEFPDLPYQDADSCKSAHYKAKKKLSRYILEHPESDLVKLLNRF